MTSPSTKSQGKTGDSTQLIFRPWLRTTRKDLLGIRTIVHVDVFAYLDPFCTLFFDMNITQAGKVLLARDMYRYRPDLNALAPVDRIPNDALRTYWGGDRARHFGAAHGALVKRARSMEGMALGAGAYATGVSILCHYVRVIDATPWPRGFVNHYQTYARRKPKLADVTL